MELDTLRDLYEAMAESLPSAAQPRSLSVQPCDARLVDALHLKAITASSPLQYRKGLQLLEARRLLRAGTLTVSAAAFDVGYESAAQFSRDYTRKFGASPKHDLPAG
ncbi:AraC family transcriptional regulator [Pyxidicoccus sp. MSG2]|uniref:helix-turn-helix domain-containing protein n=1 Tax=Pyxidicoccus sp. MSG2 TaxID=2996790 RepID=UPI002D1E3E55|nr:AraC family transcriptional regulator [Pyxidicoccus sp. MSG2]